MILDLKKSGSKFREYGIAKRFQQTIEFIPQLGETLCIGGESEFDLELLKHFKIPSYVTTVGDLDFDLWKPVVAKKYQDVLMFEVLEHLMNPLNFLMNLKRYISIDSLIYITYPHHFLTSRWGINHFHEMDSDRFETLIEKAGYKVVKHKQEKCLHFQLKDFFVNIKEFFKLITGYFLLRTFNRHFYVIKLDDSRS